MIRFLCVALVFGLTGQAGWAGKDAKTGSEELKVAGKLSDDDPKDALLKKSPHKAHEFKMQAGKVYVIDLASKDFDAVLRLENPAGKQVAINDDARPGTLDSRIVHKAKEAGTYRIIATSLDGKSGDYTLSARLGTDEDVAKADPFHDLIGKPAPEVVSAFSFNGKTGKLSDLKGNVVLLDFWAVWCGPCIATFPHLRDLEKEFKKEGLEIVGATTYYEVFGFDKDKGTLKRVGKADPETKKIVDALTADQEHDMLKDFVAHHKLNHRIITLPRDGWKQTGADYRITGIPHVVLIDRKGIIRMVRVGSGPENAAAIHEEIRRLIAEK